MSCASSAEVANESPTLLQLGFSFVVGFDALHSRVTLELRKECQSIQLARVIEGEKCELTSGVRDFDPEKWLAVLHKQTNEVQNEVQVWKVNMGEVLRGYETRTCEEFARLPEEPERRVLV